MADLEQDAAAPRRAAARAAPPMRALRAGLAALALGLLATAASHATTLTLCYEQRDLRPWQTSAGTGLDFDLLDEAARRLDLQFHYEAMPWKRCLSLLRANAIDGVFSASFLPERLAYGAFPGGAEPDPSQRLHIERYILIRRKDSPLQWDGKRLRNVERAIAAPAGYSIGTHLRELGVAVDEGANTTRAMLQKVAARRVDGAAMLEGEALAVLADDPALAADVEAAPLPLLEKAYYLMLSHALLKREPQLGSRIWAAIREARTHPAARKGERRPLR